MGKKKRDAKKQPRFEWTYAAFSEKATEITLTYDPATDAISFAQPVENTYHQVSYERSKGPKVLNRVPLQSRALKLSSNDALEGFDLLVAIDTNTKVINGLEISVTGIVLAVLVSDPDCGSRALSYRTPFCLEFSGLAEPREKIGWVMAIKELASHGHLPAKGRIGIVVDAYLGEIPEINARKRTIVGSLALPQNFTLLYASSDVGGEYGVNTLIKHADQASTQVLNYMQEGRAEPVRPTLSGQPFKGYRLIFGKQAPST
ncbi:hypothetical protein ACFSB1_08585 [Halopseudomonas phragmitis]|uniref:Uncharacterized protein n=1 Tax=Halopseudomonas phragmitis TaxID=1931241 RepID=A0A1V0B8D0_9GAMM|nr:hypothetical protein [Halopseudomonas phragmitis]AQZ96172.1 hypothetical protein BVH74_16060 [Halopseudomonas phragmitis]